MRVLVTNDDGIDAPGLEHLARGLRDARLDIIVVAPSEEASGAGAGVGPVHTMRGGINVVSKRWQGHETTEVLAVDALPALIVIAACLGAYGPPPDLIVAGINPGRNVGRSVLHSGTIGAALTGVHFNKRGLAVSIQSGSFSAFESLGDNTVHFETAAAIAGVLAPRIGAAPPRTVVNCNVPNLALEDLEGIRFARLARAGVIRSALVDVDTGTKLQLDIGLEENPAGEESDLSLTSRGYATVTPLASVSEETRPEVRAALSSALDDLGEMLGIETDFSTGADGPAA